MTELDDSLTQTLRHSSVPDWVHAPPTAAPPVPATATSLVVVAVGPAAAAVAAAWRLGADVPTVVLQHADVAAAEAGLARALAGASVGTRVLLSGPPGACLRLRAVAFNAGVEDDEVLVHPAGAGALDLWCCHCDRVSAVEAAVGDELPCPSCGRLLTVYYHVSRATGRFLGWQVDAEDAGWAARRRLARVAG